MVQDQLRSDPGNDNSAPIDFAFYSSFLAYQTPLGASFIAAMSGLGAGPLTGSFTYGQIGVGDPTSLLVLAECYPDARLIGIEPDPESAKRAQVAVAESGIGNLTIAQGPLSADNLPECDILVLGRLYSSLDAAQRPNLVKAWSDRLKPGGILCIQYSALPGAASTDVLFHFLRELAPTFDGDPRARMAGALGRLADMARAEAFVFRQLPEAPQILESMAASDPLLGAREVFNTPRHALYVTDAFNEIDPSGLVFAGHGQIPFNLLELGLPQSLRAGADSMKSVRSRELYLDYARNAKARVDLYAKPQSATREPAELLSPFFVMRMGTGPETLRRQQLAQNTGVDFTAGLYTDILDNLSREPVTIGGLLELAPLRKHARARVIKAVQLLIGADLISLVRTKHMPTAGPLPETLRLTSSLNTMLLAQSLQTPDIAPFSTPFTGQRLVMELGQRLNLHALLGGDLEPVFAGLEARGLQLTDKAGKKASFEEFKSSILSELPKFRAQDGAFLYAIGVLGEDKVQ